MRSSWNTRGMSLAERVDYYVDRSGGPDACWPWQGTLTTEGYGVLQVSGKQRRAHRVAYELAGNLLGRNQALDHLCHTAGCGTTACSHRRCVNPTHLLAGSFERNTMRGESPAAQNARKARCKRDHEFDQVRVTPAGRIGRGCSQCKAINQRERRASTR